MSDRKENKGMDTENVLPNKPKETRDVQSGAPMSESKNREQETRDAERSNRNSMILNVSDIKQRKKKSKKLESIKNSLQSDEVHQIAEQSSLESHESEKTVAPRHVSYRAYQVLKEAKRMKKDGKDKKRKVADTRERISLRQLIQELRQGTNVFIRDNELTTQISKNKSLEKSSPSMGGAQMSKRRPRGGRQ